MTASAVILREGELNTETWALRKGGPPHLVCTVSPPESSQAIFHRLLSHHGVGSPEFGVVPSVHVFSDVSSVVASASNFETSRQSSFESLGVAQTLADFKADSFENFLDVSNVSASDSVLG